MPSLELRPMTDAEYGAWRHAIIAGYAVDKIRSGDWPADVAEQRAAEETDALLPDGPRTAGVLMRVAQNAGGARVGHVWVALEGYRRPGAFIFDIAVEAEHRGKGYGRALLEATEREVAARGIDTLTLHVFGHNEVARALYDGAGYRITDLTMSKRLD